MSRMRPEDIWREKPDEDLIDAASRLSEFTPEGEQTIRAELRRRGLSDPPPPVDYCWKCGRGIYENSPDDACAYCGEPYGESARARGSVEQPLWMEVVYRSRFAHEVTLVEEELAREGIETAQGVEAPFIGAGALGSIAFPDLNDATISRGIYAVSVASPDAARALEIIAELPVSHPEDGGQEPGTPEPGRLLDSEEQVLPDPTED